MADPKLTPRPVPAQTPMIMNLGRSHLLWLVNQQLAKEGQPMLPREVDVTFAVPGGGDYSSTDVGLDDSKQIITFRWKT